jgi:hypothetical protein
VSCVNDCGVYGTVHTLYRRLPPAWRTGLKRILGTQGHIQSRFDWLTARKDATGKKRLDRALEGLISTLGLDTAQHIAGKTCIDFGAGYVPTDGVAMWLLGAREVHGVDYNNIARPREIAKAIRAADANRVDNQLESLAIDSGWRDRVDRLRRWALADSDEFPPGYTYIAPADVLASPSPLPQFDVLVSTSVLEHIAPSLMVALLDALASRENDHAAQFHRVDLRDHRDFDNAPYDFLDPSKPFDAERNADSRGNGMTLHDWETLLASHREWRLGVSCYAPGRPHLLPATVANTHVVADSLVLRSITLKAAQKARGI